MVATRIVTFLGLGNEERYGRERYERARYELDGLVTESTAMHDVATVKVELRNGNQVSLVVLGTQQVREKWFGEDRLYCSLMEEALGDRFRQVKCGFVPVPANSANEMFPEIRRALQREPISLRLPWESTHRVEPSAPDKLILDVTHGFRAQPILAMAAAGLVQSSWLQKKRQARGNDGDGAASFPVLRILYGAFEARDGDLVPVWDLTPFLDTTRLTRAIDGLMSYGRADELSDILSEMQTQAMNSSERAGNPGDSRPPMFKTLGNAAKIFADDLATARVPFLITQSARKLENLIEKVLPDIKARLPLAEQDFAALQVMCRSIQADRVVSEQGIAAGVKLVELYIHLQRFSEAAALLRELMVVGLSVQRRGSQALQPAEPRNGFLRQQHEPDGRSLSAGGTGPLFKASRSTFDLRNDIQHAGFREEPRSSAKIIPAIRRSLSDTSAALSAPAEAPEEGRVATLFVNCSNHPSSGWSEGQRQAVARLGCDSGGIQDIPFPHVDPDSDMEDVAPLARNLAASIEALNPRAVFVAGEYSLAVPVMVKLQSEGFRCVAATTQREVVEQALPDGSVEKTTVSRFVRWREVPGFGEMK